MERAEVKLRVPGILMRIPAERRESILNKSIQIALKTELARAEKAAIEAAENIARLEAKYGMNYEGFNRKLGPMMTDFQTHRDETEWSMWVDVLKETESLIKTIREALSG